jgi:hypothetical protein
VGRLARDGDKEAAARPRDCTASGPKGQVSIQTVVGHIQVRAEERTFESRLGGLLALDQGLPHDVEAVEESAFLLTIARPGEKDRPVA